MSALGVSLFKQVKQSPGLYRFLKPLAGAYANLAGYRAHGLKYDDILIEENATVQKVRLFFLRGGLGNWAAIPDSLACSHRAD
jgi:hypothetical protein